MSRFLLAFCALFLLPISAPALAQPVAAAEDPHEQLYASLVEGRDAGPAIDAAVGFVISSLSKNPAVAQVEKTHPGTLTKFGVAVRPTFVAYNERTRIEFRPRMIAVLKEGLTAAEARSLAEFYGTPIGRKLMTGMDANYTGASVLGTLTTQEDVTARHVEQDIQRDVSTTIAQLSEAELRLLVQEVNSRPAFRKMQTLMPRLTAIRAEMEGSPLSREEEAAMQQALETVLSDIGR